MQKSVDILIEALQEPMAFCDTRSCESLEKLRRDGPDLVVPREPIEAFALKEGLPLLRLPDSPLQPVRAREAVEGCPACRRLQEKMSRSVDRVYRLLGLIYPWRDIAAARYAIEHGDGRSRASAIEYVDNFSADPFASA